MIRTLRVAILAAAAAATIAAARTTGTSVRGTATGMTSASGEVSCPLYRDAAGFPDVTASRYAAGRRGLLWPTQQHLVDSVVSRAPHCVTPAERKQYFLTPIPPLWCLERNLTPYHTPEWQAWLPQRKA